jgi:hypothetical protein
MFTTGGSGIYICCIVQAHQSSASIDGTNLKEKGLHISDFLEIANFLASTGWIGRFNRRHNIAYRNLSHKNRSVDSETVGN